MAVPYADLHLQYQSIKSEIDAAVAAVIRDSAFIRGPYVDAFEREFAVAVDASHCISCANGTDALYIAMVALKVKPGDEVITTAHSWISTSAMITHAGATAVFCDTDAQTFTIDPAAIESAITPRTVGIIPVHLYGQPADMDAIMAIARRHKLWVIEDCAQAHLARFKDQQIGTFGDAATYSFYPGKNLGAMGDALALLVGGPRLLYVVAFGAVCGLLEIFMRYSRYVGVLKWLTLALFAYFGTVMVVKIPWGEAARGFLIPTLSPDPAFWTTVASSRAPPHRRLRRTP